MSKQSFIYKGSALVKGLWSSWDKYRQVLCIKPSFKAISELMSKDSLWIGLLGPDLSRESLLKAHRIWKMGFKSWADLASGNIWDPGKFQHLPLHLRTLLDDRIREAQH